MCERSASKHFGQAYERASERLTSNVILVRTTKGERVREGVKKREKTSFVAMGRKMSDGVRTCVDYLRCNDLGTNEKTMKWFHKSITNRAF